MIVLLVALLQPLPGAKWFTTSCSNGYCHGVEGAGGGAPALRGRSFSADYLTRAITNGVPGSGMRAFKEDYSAEQIQQLVEYVLSLGSVEASPASFPPIVVAGFEAGRDVFQERCAACHPFRGAGGKVAPDLHYAATASAASLLKRIISPPESSGSAYALIAVTTKDNRVITGIKRREDDESIQVYDVTSLPPVSRTISKEDIRSVERTKRSAMPGDFAKRLSEKQLAELVAFLRQTK